MIQINNELRDRAYRIACAHGFHDTEHSDEHFLMLIISEMAETIQADRKGKHADKVRFKRELKTNEFLVEEDIRFKCCFEKFIKESVEDELADVVIRCLDFAGFRNIDIDFSTLPVFTDKSLSLIDNLFAISIIIYGAKATVTLHHKINRIIVSTLCLAKQLNIDLCWHIEQKMKYNELRPMLNGKKY